MMQNAKVAAALEILRALRLPRQQLNERSALTLLALLDLKPDEKWSAAKAPLIGITPVIEFAAKHYDKKYAPNSRETIRKQTMHQFLANGIVVYNPDKGSRPVNSPHAVYQISPHALALFRSYGTRSWAKKLKEHLKTYQSLTNKYANERDMEKVPVRLSKGDAINLSPGAHSLLIKAIIEEFAPRFAPNSMLLYAGDTGSKLGFFNENALAELGVKVDKHGKMPDVVIHFTAKNWLLLIESVTSHGPVDNKRHEELKAMFSESTAGLVFVTAFPNRATMSKYLGTIAWETEVWTADAPTHLIHFNGSRFLGPYADNNTLADSYDFKSNV